MSLDIIAKRLEERLMSSLDFCSEFRTLSQEANTVLSKERVVLSLYEQFPSAMALGCFYEAEFYTKSLIHQDEQNEKQLKNKSEQILKLQELQKRRDKYLHKHDRGELRVGKEKTFLDLYNEIFGSNSDLEGQIEDLQTQKNNFEKDSNQTKKELQEKIKTYTQMGTSMVQGLFEDDRYTKEVYESFGFSEDPQNVSDEEILGHFSTEGRNSRMYALLSNMFPSNQSSRIGKIKKEKRNSPKNPSKVLRKTPTPSELKKELREFRTQKRIRLRKRNIAATVGTFAFLTLGSIGVGVYDHFKRTEYQPVTRKSDPKKNSYGSKIASILIQQAWSNESLEGKKLKIAQAILDEINKEPIGPIGFKLSGESDKKMEIVPGLITDKELKWERIYKKDQFSGPLRNPVLQKKGRDLIKVKELNVGNKYVILEQASEFKTRKYPIDPTNNKFDNVPDFFIGQSIEEIAYDISLEQGLFQKLVPYKIKYTLKMDFDQKVLDKYDDVHMHIIGSEGVFTVDQLKGGIFYERLLKKNQRKATNVYFCMTKGEKAIVYPLRVMPKLKMTIYIDKIK